MPGMSCPNSEAAEMDEPASCLLIYCHANGSPPLSSSAFAVRCPVPTQALPLPGEDIGILYEAGHWLCDTLGALSYLATGLRGDARH